MHTIDSTERQPVLHPPKLRAGDQIRLVSPGSPPNPDDVFHTQRTFESWGLEVTLRNNVFRKYGYLAGTDDQRPGDLNEALRDPSVRAIVATRGGKGSYRIADQLDFAAARNHPKFLVGFSDITILQMSLWRHSRVVGLHGALYLDETTGTIPRLRSESLRAALMEPGPTNHHISAGRTHLAADHAGHRTRPPARRQPRHDRRRSWMGTT